MKYTVTDNTEANATVAVGETVYDCPYDYGCSREDTLDNEIYYISVSTDPSGYPFFTIPRGHLRATQD